MVAAAAVEAVADAGGVTRLPVLASQAPLVLRRTPEAVYLVGGTAGPLGGDSLSLRVSVGAGAFLRLQTAAASVALPGLDEAPSVLRVSIAVGAGGRLEYLPEPVVVTDGARHATLVTVTLAAGAVLVLRDEVLLGRHGEAGGTARTDLQVSYDGRPLLRHSLSFSGTDPVSLGPAMLAGHRAIGTLLLVNAPGPQAPLSADGAGQAGPSQNKDGAGQNSPDQHALDQNRPGVDSGRTGGLGKGAAGQATVATAAGRAGAAGTAPLRGSPTRAVMPLAGPGVFVTALAQDAVSLRRRLGVTLLSGWPSCSGEDSGGRAG